MEKQKVKVTKIVLEINDKKIELSLEEAKSLFELLGSIFKENKEYIYIPYPSYPVYPTYPYWSYTVKTDTGTADFGQLTITYGSNTTKLPSSSDTAVFLS